MVSNTFNNCLNGNRKFPALALSKSPFSYLFRFPEHSCILFFHTVHKTIAKARIISGSFSKRLFRSGRTDIQFNSVKIALLNGNSILSDLQKVVANSVISLRGLILDPGGYQSVDALKTNSWLM
jgi:hypothetical protein